MINHDVNRYQKSITVLLNVTKIFIRHHYTLKSFTYGEKNDENSTVGESSNKWMLGIILWHHNTCKFSHLWRHLFISEMLVSAYIKFYHATSQEVTDNQKQDSLEAFNNSLWYILQFQKNKRPMGHIAYLRKFRWAKKPHKHAKPH